MDKKTISLNYLYFGALFLFLITLTSYNVLLINSYPGSKIFFLIFSWGQCFLEIICYIFFGWLISLFAKRGVFLAYIGIVFLFFLSHSINFVLNRIWDLSVWDAVQLFVLDESWDNFIEVLHASNIPLKYWLLGALFAILVPFLGIGFYVLTEKISQKKPFPIRKNALVQSFFFIPCALFVWDFSASRVIHRDAYNAYTKSLPWKTTFIEPKTTMIEASYPLKAPRSEEETQKILAATDWQAKKNPNIYLFIIESLREDFITNVHSPHIATFKEENIAIDLSLASANGTQLSWFSIFYSDFPYRWAHYRNSGWNSGGTALQILKKMGYKIHVYSSAGLGYYHMDELLFGKNTNLLDSYHLIEHHHPVQTYEADAKTLQVFQDELEGKESGHVFIFFWDSTHFDYSWPRDKAYPFTPICDEKQYFLPCQTKESLELIKNSYRNAIYYVDSLFALFKEKLAAKGLWEDALVVLTGDHGEEFYEHGRLLHATHLSHQQTNAPIYYKFPFRTRNDTQTHLTSHMDIFPSIVSYLTDNPSYAALLEGESIFAPRKWNYALVARYYASRAPYEFFIHDGNKKVLARFSDHKNIFRSNKMHLLSIKDRDDKDYLQNCDDIEKCVRAEFGPAIRRIFAP